MDRVEGSGVGMAGQVYFLLAPHSLCVKIGFTTHRPQHRVTSLQSGSPEPLMLLGSVAGEIWLERGLHKRFKDLHVRGEWFALKPDLRDWLLTWIDEDGQRLLYGVPDFDYDKWNCNPEFEADGILEISYLLQPRG